MQEAGFELSAPRAGDAGARLLTPDHKELIGGGLGAPDLALAAGELPHAGVTIGERERFEFLGFGIEAQDRVCSPVVGMLAGLLMSGLDRDFRVPFFALVRRIALDRCYISDAVLPLQVAALRGEGSGADQIRAAFELSVAVERMTPFGGVLYPPSRNSLDRLRLAKFEGLFCVSSADVLFVPTGRPAASGRWWGERDGHLW